MIHRMLQKVLSEDLFKGKALIVTGPRQVGKTTLLKSLIEANSDKNIFLNCDEADVRRYLTDTTSTTLRNIFGDARLICIDEVQRIVNIGITLKLITDNFPDKQLIVTGSSSIGIRDNINEPLTGRKYEYSLFPLSYAELKNHFGWLEEQRNLEQRIIWGSYPDVVKNPSDARRILRNIANSYLYKDILSFMEVRKPDLVEQLAEMLALQIGSEVSYNELAASLRVDITTVQRYIQLLEDSFVIFRLRSFSRNVRNEIKKGRKIYFYDTGIRNAIIDNFSPMNLRPDAGALWENYLIVERMKRNMYSQQFVHSRFWRTKQQQEIDYIEECDGKISAFEFKWSGKKRAALSATFAKAYPNTEFKCITRENYDEFLS